jgi:hypothetical protein
MEYGIRDPESEIRGSGKAYSGSRIQWSKRHRIPDPGSATLLHTGFLFCLVKYSVESNYPEKLTHDKDYQWHQKC